MKKYMLGMIIGLLGTNVLAYAHYDKATARLFDQKGNIVGKVEFAQHKDGVQVKAQVTHLAPGFHGFHVHAIGLCTVVNTVPATPPFTSAGGHFKLVTTSNHRDHNGDFPVLLVNANGTAKVEFKTDRFKIKELFDADGSAVIIHADPDNYANIPVRYAQFPLASPVVTGPDAMTLATGDSGGRSVCGVVKKY